jgi:hypothetical protein
MRVMLIRNDYGIARAFNAKEKETIYKLSSNLIKLKHYYFNR